MLRTNAIIATACLLLAVGACDDPASPPVEEGLSAAEIDALVSLVVTTGLFPDPLPQTNPWPCPLGGAAGRTLAFTFPAPGSISRVGTVVLTACQVSAGSRRLELSGTFAVEDLFLQELGAIVGAQGFYRGEVSWTLESRSGTCSLDLEPSVVGGRLVVSGTACGASVQRDA